VCVGASKLDWTSRVDPAPELAGSVASIKTKQEDHELMKVPEKRDVLT